MRKIARGESAGLPTSAMVFMVAAAFATTPEAVRAWPADDYRQAVTMLPAVRPRVG